jgi:hypothetical protein
MDSGHMWYPITPLAQIADAARQRDQAAQRLAEKRTEELKKARAMAEERAEDERRKADGERKARALAEERAEDERSQRLKLEREMQDLRAKLGVQGIS